MCVYAHVDASCGVHVDGKSHTGIAISLGHSYIYVHFGKQKLVSCSFTEADLFGLSEGAGITIWSRDYVLNQGYVIGPTIGYQDNLSIMAMAEKGRSTSKKTRHINARYFFIKDRIETGDTVFQYLAAKDMIADVLTKPLPGKQFRRLRGLLLNCADVSQSDSAYEEYVEKGDF